MLVFMLLTMFMGGAILLSASLLCLNKATPSQGSGFTKTANGNVVYDDMELPEIRRTSRITELSYDENSASPHDKLLEFTCTTGKADKQLPLIGMPDKAFYHIH